MPGKGAVRRGKARLQRGQCKTLAALFFCCTPTSERKQGICVIVSFFACATLNAISKNTGAVFGVKQ
jgi:hypothetical protein